VSRTFEAAVSRAISALERTPDSELEGTDLDACFELLGAWCEVEPFFLDSVCLSTELDEFPPEAASRLRVLPALIFQRVCELDDPDWDPILPPLVVSSLAILASKVQPTETSLLELTTALKDGLIPVSETHHETADAFRRYHNWQVSSVVAHFSRVDVPAPPPPPSAEAIHDLIESLALMPATRVLEQGIATLGAASAVAFATLATAKGEVQDVLAALARVTGIGAFGRLLRVSAEVRLGRTVSGKPSKFWSEIDDLRSHLFFETDLRDHLMEVVHNDQHQRQYLFLELLAGAIALGVAPPVGGAAESSPSRYTPPLDASILEKLEAIRIGQEQTRTEIVRQGRTVERAISREAYWIGVVESMLPPDRRAGIERDLAEHVRSWTRLPPVPRDQLIVARYLTDDPALTEAQSASHIIRSIGLAIESLARTVLPDLNEESADLGAIAAHVEDIGFGTEDLRSDLVELKNLRNEATHRPGRLGTEHVYRAWRLALGTRGRIGCIEAFAVQRISSSAGFEGHS
jgi:hypothetical protein